MADGQNTDFDRARGEARLSLVEGLIRALDSWDEISAAVASAVDRAEAARTLMGERFGFDEVEAQHVLDLRIATRTTSARGELEEERVRLRRQLAECS